MSGFDPAIATSDLRLWLAAGSAALLFALCTISFARPRSSEQVPRSSAGTLLLAAILGASMTWALLARAWDQDAERRALEMRAGELAAQAIAPGSPLACLDGSAGKGVEAACENALFASPETVAAATSYVSARFQLFVDMIANNGRGGASINAALESLRRSLEADPYGFVSHTLMTVNHCTKEDCKSLTLFRDPKVVQANLSDGTFDRHIEHFQLQWAQSAETPVADATGATAQSGGHAPRKVPVNIDFPSAASIPPVSIMNPEPKGPAVPASAAAAGAPAVAATAADTNAASRRSRKPALAASPQGDSSQAATTAPAAPPVEPVWIPAPPAAPAAPAAAAAATAAPALSSPVQLHPYPAEPEASAGAPAHTQ
jgi:hypothetical protein